MKGLILLIYAAIVVIVPIIVIAGLIPIMIKSYKLIKIRLRKVDRIIEEDREKRKSDKSVENKKQPIEPKWYPTGWVFNEETQKWDPPDYLSAESKEKWVWDAKKQVWIDQVKEARLERYHEFRKSQGKGPSYEEWKAAREAEQQDKSTN